MGGLSPPRPLGPEDDRSRFDCRRDALNGWFRQHAWRNQQANVSRTSLLCDTASGEIAAYVTLAAAQIERERLAKADQRNRPDPVPAALLGQLGVDRRFQGRGCARSLMMFAFQTVVRLSREIGCFALITHPLDDEVRAFYRQFGFEDTPFDPRRSMIVRIKDLTANGFGT
ncbi:MAG: GNAT family N-acetyltransferase [Bosea sp. (in: a-proteobacteria)]|jgi:GNAT superfamily N-acetyltransferase